MRTLPHEKRGKMNYLNKIDAKAYQRFFLTGNVGQRITLTLRYMPTQEAWFMDVEYEDFKLNGIKVTNSPNILRKYRNKIPFGFLCIVSDGLEPFFIDDFVNRRVDLYLLNAEDVITVEEGAFQ